jgi:GntR family transcriptional regulator
MMPRSNSEEPHIATGIDPSSPVPLYFQVEADLRRRIQSGELVPGAALPTEHDLCREYGVSRFTVRAALARLVADRLISRSAGRGTFVLPRSERVRFYLDGSFSQQMAELGRRARSRVLSASVGHVAESDPAALHAEVGAPCFRLSRLRFGDDEPIGIQHTTVLTRKCPGLEAYDFANESLYAVLAREYDLPVSRIQHVVGAAAADAEQAELLGITEGDPLLIVYTTAFLGKSEVLEYTASYYRADRYEYSITHTF